MIRKLPVAAKSTDAATAVVLATHEMTADGSLLVTGQLTAAVAGLSVAYFPRLLCNRNAGVITSPAGQAAVVTQPTDGGAAQAFQPVGVALAFVGNFVQIVVHGVAATPINWQGDLTLTGQPGTSNPDQLG